MGLPPPFLTDPMDVLAIYDCLEIRCRYKVFNMIGVIFDVGFQFELEFNPDWK